MAFMNLVTSKGGVKAWRGRATGRALVEAVSFAGEEQAAHDGQSYIFFSRSHLAAATAGALMYIKNTSSTNSIHITRMYIDPIGALTPTDVILTQVINPTTVTGGTTISANTSAAGIVQKNTSHVNALLGSGDVTYKVSDGSSNITFTGGDYFHAYNVIADGASTQRNMNGTNVIGPGGEWLIGWESAGTATDAELISLSINAYLAEDNPE